MDFSCAILSIIPSIHFEKYLKANHPDHLPHWRMIQLIKMLKDIEKDIDKEEITKIKE